MGLSRQRGCIRMVACEKLEARRLLDALVNNNTGATGTSHFTQSEPSIVTDGTNVIVAFDDSGSFASGANKFTGFSRSTNGGTTFTDGDTLPTNANGDAGEARLARDAIGGNLYLGTLSFSGTGTIQIFRSTNNGATWSLPTVGTPGGSSEDVYGLAVDNFPGTGSRNVYLASRRFGGAPGIYFFRSTDLGTTFGPVGGTLIAASTNSPQGGAVVVGPDHSVYVFWYQTAGGVDSIQMRKSTDLGVTFGAPVTVASNLVGGTNGDLGLTGLRNGTATPVSFRSNSFPRPAINPVNGHLYLVYNDDAPGTDKADVFFTMSTSGGATWSPRVRVNDDSTLTDQWHPAIAVMPGGNKLGIFYYSRQEDPTSNNAFRCYGRLGSISGGAVTFDPSFAVSDVASLPEFGRDSVVNSVYMGDWTEAVATNSGFYVVWGDSRSDLSGGAPRRDPNVYFEKISLAPAVLSSEFRFERLPLEVRFTFSEPVDASIGPSDFIVTRNSDGAIFTPSVFSYDFASRTAILSFNSQLPNADYTARALASGISSNSGVALAADATHPFFVLAGDATRNRVVNLDDFNVLAANFGLAGKTFSQGNFSYDGGGLVNLDDFNILAANFGVGLSSARRADAFARESDPITEDRLIEQLL